MRELWDLDYALAGWLVSPWGSVRHIPDLDRFARDARAFGISLWWDLRDGARLGFCTVNRQEILLAGRLAMIRYPPWALRRVLGEEIGHAVVGLNDTRAKIWAETRYGGLIHPPAWAPVAAPREHSLTVVSHQLTYS